MLGAICVQFLSCRAFAWRMILTPYISRNGTSIVAVIEVSKNGFLRAANTSTLKVQGQSFTNHVAYFNSTAYWVTSSDSDYHLLAINIATENLTVSKNYVFESKSVNL
jgi:hypothetical protein